MLRDTFIDRALRSNTLLYSVAIVLRVVIFSIPSVAEALAHRVELVTPVTSYKRLTEGVYLYESNVPPYDGGLFHQAPLLLSIFSFLTSVPIPYFIPFVYAFVDAAIAHALQRIAVIQQQEECHQPKLAVEKQTAAAAAKRIRPFTVAALYLFNPLTIASCISKSTLIFTNLSIAMAILASRLGRVHTAMLWAAFASYLSFYPAMLVPPLLLMGCSSNISSNRKQMLSGGLIFGICLVGFLGGSRLLVGSWDFIPATYGIILFISDLTPNTGMFWYFFIEIFDQFRSFFMVVFQLHGFIFVAPLCIRLRNHPLVILTVMAGIMAVFKSYPAAGDAALFLGLIPLHDQLFKYCRYGFLVTNVLMYSSILAPIFWHLWLYAGSGNANFFYAITLVYNLGLILLLIDLVYAVTRRDFDIANPNAIGKVVVHK
ncbi:GPI transamidase subunit PIG-U [Dichotomocladium elegans]|nr:GPI transamidase subunit PIG-U [Dichotomocladium elegans]